MDRALRNNANPDTSPCAEIKASLTRPRNATLHRGGFIDRSLGLAPHTAKPDATGEWHIVIRRAVRAWSVTRGCEEELNAYLVLDGAEVKYPRF